MKKSICGVFWILFGTLLTVVFCVATESTSHLAKSTSRMLILYVDGLRWDYLNNASLLGVETMRSEGCHVSRVVPIFPSDCHSNMRAIFAGQKHLDPGFFASTYRPNLTTGDLLWHSAAHEGQRVNLYHFPFCSQPLSVWKVSDNLHCLPLSNSSQPLLATITEVLGRFEGDLLDLAIVYYGKLDRLAHSYGPESEELYSDVEQELDKTIQLVLETLRRPSLQDAHFFIVSDHGMSAFKGTVNADQLLPDSFVARSLNFGSMFAIWPEPERLEDVIERLQGSLSRIPVELYSRSNVPHDWTIDRHNMPPVLLVANPGYVFRSRYKEAVYTAHSSNYGVHNYPPEEPDMHTTLFAFGPRLKKAFSIPPEQPVSTHHVHALVSYLLGLQRENVVVDEPLLRQLLNRGSESASFSTTIHADPIFICIAVLCTFVTVLVVIMALIHCYRRFVSTGYSKQSFTSEFVFKEDEKFHQKASSLMA